ncbi:MAG: haloacid dehalogenase-like hydrolase [Firmicutes bacterium]|nr:haloacid dehalogenase-like hydrolase [Alicyclobacillaceae bacterium]MCL6498118.1 haloacid dehalogenase-like hydrolase [Bacillota bacterium]
MFPQNVIAVIWDFDHTLIPGYMEDPILEAYGIEPRHFWQEVFDLRNKLTELHPDVRIAPDSLYLNHLLSYVASGRLPGLSNQRLRDLGRKLQFYPGMPEFLGQLKEKVASEPRWAKYRVELEYYIVSNGLRQTILGSAVAPWVTGVWACEFLEVWPLPGLGTMPEDQQEPRTIRQVGYVVDHTTKTRALFEINKGSNVHPEIDVNASLPEAERRIPFANMIYIADGPSDIPMFSILNRNGGKTFAVYNPNHLEEFHQNYELQRQGRVQGFGPADYRPGSHTALWIEHSVELIADAIVDRLEQRLFSHVGLPPRHITTTDNLTLPEVDPARNGNVLGDTVTSSLLRVPQDGQAGEQAVR